MAGVKGKSGGARPGAGRKPKETVEIAPETAKVVDGEPLDPRPTLELIALGHLEVSPAQLKALTALLPYMHAKKEVSKGKPPADKPAGVSKYGPRAAPRLIVNNK